MDRLRHLLRSLGSNEGIALVAILVAGLAIRVAYLAEFSGAPDFRYPAIDAGFHDYWARSIAVEDWERPTTVSDPEIESSPYLRPPGYPYFLAAVYTLSGGSYLAPRVVQIGLGLLACVLVYAIGRRWLGSGVGLVAAALQAGYWVLVYFEAELHAPALLNALLLGWVLLVLRWRERPGLGRALVAGLVLGLAALVRPNVLLLAPFALLWAGLCLRRDRKRGLPPLAAFGPFAIGLVLGTVAAVLPATIRNAVVAKDLVLISSNAGINLFIGNHAGADGFVTSDIPGVGRFETCYDYPGLVRNLEQKVGGPLKDSEVSKWFAGEALRFIAENPGEFLALTARKAALFFAPGETSHNKVIALERDHSRILGALPGGFPAVLACSLLGIGLFLGDRKKRAEPPVSEIGALLLGVLATLFLSVLPFFVAARYRVPALPFLFLFGASAIVRLADTARARRWMALAAGIATLVLLRLAATDIPGSTPASFGKWHMDSALAFERAGDWASAEAEYGASLEASPGSTLGQYQFAVALAKHGEEERAIEHYRRATRLDPEYSKAHNNLGILLTNAGRPAEAGESFRAAIRIDSGYALAHFNLATLHWRERQYAEAATACREVVRLAPEQVDAQRMLGLALAATGAYGEAEERLRRVLELAPGNPLHEGDLAWLLATCPDPAVRDGAEALRLVESAGRRTKSPTWQLLEALAAACAETGDFQRAARTQSEVLRALGPRAERAGGRLGDALAAYEAGRPFRYAGPPR